MIGNEQMKVFISHSTEERMLGERLLDALVSAGIPKNDIFFSSKYHNGVELGEEIDSTVRNALKSSEVIILLLSRSFYKSEYCLNEVGAAWVLGKPIIPILTDGLRIGDMKGFVNGSRIAFRPTENSAHDLASFLKAHLSIPVEAVPELDGFVVAAKEYSNTRYKSESSKPVSLIETMILQGSLTDAEVILLSYILYQEDPRVLDGDEFDGANHRESEQARLLTAYFQQYGYASYEAAQRTLEQSGLIKDIYSTEHYSTEYAGFELDIVTFRDLISMSDYAKAHIDSVKARRLLPDLSDTTTVENDIEDWILSSSISQTELLLFSYVVDEARASLGDRWMAESEIHTIKEWEQKNSLNDLLSTNYQLALRQLLMHDWMEVASMTSYGNPREYRFTTQNKKKLSLLSDRARKRLQAIKSQNRLVFDEDVPF